MQTYKKFRNCKILKLLRFVKIIDVGFKTITIRLTALAVLSADV